MSTLPSVAPAHQPGKQTLAPFRLRRHADYQRVYAASRKHFSASLSYFFRVRPSGLLPVDVQVSPAPELNTAPGDGLRPDKTARVKPRTSPALPPPIEGPRVGLTVGRVLGKAVTRNRIKRRMREAVRLHLAILHQAPVSAIDLVLHPRKSVAKMDFSALQRELAKVFSQVAAQAANPAAPLQSTKPHGPKSPRSQATKQLPYPGPAPSKNRSLSKPPAPRAQRP